MWRWLAVFAVAFLAEWISETWSTRHYEARRAMQPHRAARWGVLLLALGWADLGGVAVGWPLSALLAGSLTGGYLGGFQSTKRMHIQGRIDRKRRRERKAARREQRVISGLDQPTGDRGRDPGDQGTPALHRGGSGDDRADG